MYLNIKNKSFKIRLSKIGSPIQITDLQTNTYIVSAPMDLRDKELIQYLQLNHKKLITEYKNKINQKLINEIILYNKKLQVLLDNNTSNSYKKNGCIYSSKSTKSTLNLKKIAAEIVIQDICQIIDFWEDKLGFIIDNIQIKNYKKSLYKISKINQSINFSTKLMNYQFTFVEYLVVRAVFEYLNIDQKNQNKYMEEYVQDYKQSIKIYTYESENGF